jgi:uncharacterized protein (UPF0147 family)
MRPEEISEVLAALSMVEQDEDLPKNIKSKVKQAICILNDDQKNMGLRVDSSIEHLGDVVDDPNLPPHNRMQLWSVVSQLESQ